jgi:PAS domain S-box-containing protein
MNHLDVEQWRRLVGSGPMLAWRADHHGVRHDFNAAWTSSTGLSAAELEGGGWWQAVHDDDRAALLATLRANTHTPFEHRYRLRAADGGWHTVHDVGAPIVNDLGAWAGTVGSTIVIDALDADAFFELSLDHLAISSLSGELRRLNSAWTRTLGYSRAALLAMAPNSLVHPDDVDGVVSAREALLRHGKSVEGTVTRYRRIDGSYRFFEWHSVADLERGLVYASARDITLQRQAQQQLEAMQRQLVINDRMASIGTLAGGVAHEINNPLAAVVGNIDLLIEELTHAPSDLIGGGVSPPAPRDTRLGDNPQSGFPVEPQMLAIARDIQRGASRIATIVDSLKTFSRVQSEPHTALDVREVLELAISMSNSELRHRARLATRYGDVPQVRGDRARLAQVFIHLLVNAAQAIPHDATDKTIELNCSTDEHSNVIVDVRDHGIGMPSHVVEHAFDPFFTTRDVGSAGLGLSICRNIIVALGGTITLESRVGGGTNVRVVLPGVASNNAQTTTTAPTSSTPPAATRRAHVLVVDDEPAVGVVLVRVLRDHHVIAVTSVAEAVAVLETGQRFDLVLSDLMMPEQSGVEFYRILQERFAEHAPRVVFMSGGAFTASSQAFLEGRRRLDKPFDARQVRELVANMVVDHR